MALFSSQDILWQILKQLDHESIKNLCEVLKGRCHNILTANAFWKDKLQIKGIDHENIKSPINDYERIYHIINGLEYEDIYQLFLDGISENDVTLIKVLTESKYIDITTNRCEPFKIAASNNALNIMEYFLNTRLCDDVNLAILAAAISGHVEMVRLLLDNGNYDLLINNNIVVDSYLYANVKRPDKSPFIDPRNNRRYNPTKNFEHIMPMLLSVKLKLTSEDLLYNTILTGNNEAIMILLMRYQNEHIKIDLAVHNNLLMRLAAEDNLIDVVDLLMNDYYKSKINPADLNNEAINRAAYHKHYDIVKLLLSNSVVLNGPLTTALNRAILNDDVLMTKLIINKTDDDYDKLLESSIILQSYNVAKYLLKTIVYNDDIKNEMRKITLNKSPEIYNLLTKKP